MKIIMSGRLLFRNLLVVGMTTLKHSNIIKQRATTDKDNDVRSTAVQELARGWHDDPETLNIIKQLATTDEDSMMSGVLQFRNLLVDGMTTLKHSIL